MVSGKDTNDAAHHIPPAKDLGHIKLLYCGFISGLVQAGIFNPWDRALYLSVSNDRPFLNKLNFVSPMNGVFQTIFQRGISAGLYFPLEEIFTLYLKESFKNSGSQNGATNETWLLLCAGLMAGAGNGIIMNPISSIKYHYWGLSGGGVGFSGAEGSTGVPCQVKKNSFSSVAADMLRRGGLRPFFVGVNATISRDVIFGGVFAYLRHELPKLPFFATWCTPSVAVSSSNFTISSSSFSQRATSTNSPSTASATQYLPMMDTTSNHPNTIEARHCFLTDLISGLIATTMSSPLNYVRNIHYSLPPDIKPASTLTVLRELWQKAGEEKTLISRLSHIQSRLRLGWGTARVGCGMALASQFYSFIKSQI